VVRRSLVVLIMGIAAVSPATQAAAQPTKRGFEPQAGPSSTLVEFRGAEPEGAIILWDADSDAPVQLSLPIAGAAFFSVPHDAAAGEHAVRLVHPSGQSTDFTFNVTDEFVDTRPRVDDITLVGANFDEGTVEATLYVQGANIDVDATILVNGTPVPSQAHKALRKDLYGMMPEALGYPIRHYLSHVVPLGPRPVGETIAVSVRNESGQTSATRQYALPGSSDRLDSDGDFIPDVWETAPIDFDGDGNADLDLSGFGVDPHRKDILVELDMMQGLLNALPEPVRRTVPREGSVPIEQDFVRSPFDVVEFVFANAPVLNPFGPNGINLRFDTSGTVPFADTIAFLPEQQQSSSYMLFEDLKSVHFDSATRGGIFHYGIWGSRHAKGNTGESDIDHLNKGGGDDFLIAIDRIPGLQSMRARAEVLMHEFGHNLGQWHGGTDHLTDKPYYWSSMSYSWLYRASSFYNDAWRRQNPTCLHAYYQREHAVEPGGEAFNASLDMMLPAFSEGLARSLDDPDDLFDEHVGLCGHAIDLNEDGDTDDAAVRARDLRIFGKIMACSQAFCPDGRHFGDHANWTSLRFDGPATNGTVVPDEGGVSMLSMGSNIVANLGGQPPTPASASTGPSVESPGTEYPRMAQARDLESLRPSLKKRLGEQRTLNDQKQDAEAAPSQALPNVHDVGPGAGAAAQPTISRAEPVPREDVVRNQLERLADQKWGEVNRRRVLEDIQIGPGSGQELFVTRSGSLEPGAGNAPAPKPEIEFLLEGGPIERVDRLVYSEGSNILADALETGAEPVILTIEQAGIVARQVTGDVASPEVFVTVAEETRTLRPGESGLFKDGSLEIEVLTSTGPSATSVVDDGPPYALRIQVSTVQPR